jgi:hypothetical protein
MKHCPNVLRLLGVVAPFLFFASGCAMTHDHSWTYKTWANEDFNKWNKPVQHPHLALFELPDRNDLVVQYDSISEQLSAIKRQTYYLRSNQERIVAGKAPRFVDRALTTGLSPVPVYEAQSFWSGNTLDSSNFAILAQSGRHFTWTTLGKEPQTFDLPVYSESTATLKRIGLTPFAVVGDAMRLVWGSIREVVRVLFENADWPSPKAAP